MKRLSLLREGRETDTSLKNGDGAELQKSGTTNKGILAGPKVTIKGPILSSCGLGASVDINPLEAALSKKNAFAFSFGRSIETLHKRRAINSTNATVERDHKLKHERLVALQ